MNLKDALLKTAEFDEAHVRSESLRLHNVERLDMSERKWIAAGVCIENTRLLPLLQACAEVVEALEFYADKKKWVPRHHALSGINPEADIDGENGERANQALATLRERLKGVAK